MRAVVVALAGPSGAGKTTVVRALAELGGWTPIDEAFYRLRPRPSLRFASQRELLRLERRLLAEEGRRYREARELSELGRPVVADTGFLDPVSYTAGLLALGLASATTFHATLAAARREAEAGGLGVPDLAVRLAVAGATRQRRTSLDPTGHPRAFRARHEAVGRVESDAVTPALARVLPGRVRIVPAEGAADDVARRVEALAARTRPLRDPGAAALRALEAIDRLAGTWAAAAAKGNLKRRTSSSRAPR